MNGMLRVVADRNTLIDKFHLIAALPYVDEIVSDDDFFHKIYPVAPGRQIAGDVLDPDDHAKHSDLCCPRPHAGHY